MKTLYDHYKGSWAEKLNDPIGIELEVEFTQPAPEIKISNWISKKEGSLRYYGMEYINPRPIAFERKRRTVESLVRRLVKVPYIPDSPRTSIHVHRNVMDYSATQIWTGVCAYWLIENLLFKYCGSERENNLFCLRLKDAQGILNIAMNDLTENKHGPFYNFRGDHLRYGGINLNAVCKFGSLEFRGMRGVVDSEVIDTWSTQVAILVSNAIEKYGNPENLLDQYFKMDKLEFLRSLLAEDFVNTLIDQNKDWRSLISENVGLIMQVCYVHDWDKYQNKINTSKIKDVVEDWDEPVPPRRRNRADGDTLIARYNQMADGIRGRNALRPVNFVVGGIDPIIQAWPDAENPPAEPEEIA